MRESYADALDELIVRLMEEIVEQEPNWMQTAGEMDQPTIVNHTPSRTKG